MTVQTYTGSCHCGGVTFEVDLDLAEGGGKCNCRMCRKTRNWSASVKPDAFRLLSEPSATSDYFRNGFVHWPFCKTCGVTSFARGRKPDGTEMIAINLRCLEGIELAGVATKQVDGRSA